MNNTKKLSPENSNRLDYLDAVRAFALILGIVFHASLSFMPIFIGWAVMDISTSDVAAVFALISHSFRLELFFLIAGYLGYMSLGKQGIKSFVLSRLVRIAIPFTLGWLVLRPLIVSGWVIGGESMRDDVNIWAGLANGFSTLSFSAHEVLVGTHLWFLYYLLLISGIVLLLHYAVCFNVSLKQWAGKWSNRMMIWLCFSRLSVWILTLPTVSCLWFMGSWGVDTPDKSLVPNIPVLLLYGGFFLVGWLFSRQSDLLEKFIQLSWGTLAVGAVAIIATLKLSVFEMNTAHPKYMLLKVSYLLSYAVMMWSLVVMVIGISRRFFNNASRAVRYVADASYWLYLIHLPIVIWLQIAFAELPIYWGIKWLSICVITIAISLMLYQLFVRSTMIGRVLTGNKK